jgi:ribosomal protein L11 methylase PrmA
LDIGCNEGKFLQRLSRDEEMTLLVGMDIDECALQVARDVYTYNYIYI